VNDDELSPNERLALDAWEPMTPSPGFPERVLGAVPTARRWFPYVATAVTCGAAVAIAMVILMQPRQPGSPDAPQVAIETVDSGMFVAPDATFAYELDAAVPVLPSDAYVPIIVDGAVLNPYVVDGGLADRFDVEIPPTGTFTIHHPAGTPAVRVMRQCAGPTLLEVARAAAFDTIEKSAAGTAGAVVTLSPGRWWYRTSCATSTTIETGVVQVVKDDAQRFLPAPQGASTVVVDGKTWRIAHSGTIPDVIVRTPPGAPAGNYTLHHAISMPLAPRVLAGNAVTLAGTSLHDGTYELFLTLDGQTYGKPTKLAIELDPGAQLLEAHIGGISLAEGIVTGHVAPGWTIERDNQPIAIDSNHGFAFRIYAGSRVAVRVTHPRYGTHYYVLR
jgi:hypothetical protein